MTTAQNFDLTFNHYAINVEDLQTSVDFYENVMGLTQITNQTQNNNIRWFGIGDHLELHVIQADTKNISLIKGVHLSFTLSNLDDFVKHLSSKEVYYESWQGEALTTNTRPDGIKQIYLQDPDGYWIEINDAAAQY
mgnify:CR=1 FL=1